MSYADYCGINSEPYREPCLHLRTTWIPNQGCFCVECEALLYGAPTPRPTQPNPEPAPGDPEFIPF